MDTSPTQTVTHLPESREERRRQWRRQVAWVVVGAALLVGVIGGGYRAWNDRPDWRDLAAEVRYVWQHGQTAPGTAMFGYLPTATFVLWPFMVWAPKPVGIGLYVLSNLLAGAASIWIVKRWWLPDRPAGGSIIWPVLLVGVNFAHAIQANQLTMWTLLLCAGGLALVESASRKVRGGVLARQVVGGLMLGLAILIKTMPAVFGVYLLLRRRWLALAGVAVAVLLFDALPSVAFFGWRGAIDEHRAWFRRAGWHSNRRQIEEPLLWANRHGSNASYAAVLTRWLRGVPDVTSQVVLKGQPPNDVVEQTRASLRPNQILTLDPMPPRESGWQRKDENVAWVPRFHVADLSAETVRWIWGGSLAIGATVLVLATWLSQRSANWAPVAAIWMLAMFWPSPMARHYYLAWAFPALAVVWFTLDRELIARELRWSAGMRLAGAAIVAWTIGVACIGWFLARWYGVHLLALALLTAATAWAWYRGRGGPHDESWGLEPAATDPRDSCRGQSRPETAE